MTNREFFKERRMAELPAFLRVLKAVPQGRLDYRPDPKARTAAEIAWLLTEEEGSLATLLEKGAVEWKDTPPPARFEAGTGQLSQIPSQADRPDNIAHCVE